MHGGKGINISNTLAYTSQLTCREYNKLTKILSNERMHYHLDRLIGSNSLNKMGKALIRIKNSLI